MNTSTLQMLPSLIGVPIQQIVAGPEHSMAVSLSGHIFSWGRNRKGRLGLGACTSSVVNVPTRVDSEEVSNILFKCIATGPTHSAAIAAGGKMYLCGDNSDCQLGYNYS